MAFEIHEPKQFSFPAGIEEGEIALDAGGTMTIRESDLAIVGIKDRAVVMVDAETFRVGLRAVRDGEGTKTFACRPIARRGGSMTGRCKLYLASAIRRLSLDPADLKGRRELMVKGEGVKGILTLSLMEPTAKG